LTPGSATLLLRYQVTELAPGGMNSIQKRSSIARTEAPAQNGGLLADNPGGQRLDPQENAESG
jgi:hypothetical protein